MSTPRQGPACPGRQRLAIRPRLKPPEVPVRIRINVLTAVAAALVAGAQLAAQTDFQWHGPLATGQTLEIKNINGDVRARPSTSTEAAVTAVKTARRSNP